MLDIDYMNRFKDFTVDPVNFSDLDDLVQELHDDGLQVTIILVSYYELEEQFML